MKYFLYLKESSFTAVIFNSSYRKYLDTHKHENYNEYEIRLKQIESEMTNSLLKNKKILNYDVTGFTFNNEVFTYKIGDLISNFKYDKSPINLDDKEVIYKFIKNNDGNIEKYKIIINNFIILIEYLNKAYKDKNDKINENTKIIDIEIVKDLKNISKDFKELFQGQNQDIQDKQNKSNPNGGVQDKQNKNNPNDNNSKVNLNVSKITNIFNYFLELIFKYVKKDIEKHQENNLKKKVYNWNDKDMTLKKDDLASAIRLFVTLVLFREREKDKEEKIKSNEKNVFDYLKNKDLWKSSLYNNKSRFEEDFSKLKGLNIKIKEVLFFYNYLVDNKDEEFEKEIENYIKKKEDDIIRKIELTKKLAKDNEKQGKEEESDIGSEGGSDGDDDSDESGQDSEDDSEDSSDEGKTKRKKKKKGGR